MTQARTGTTGAGLKVKRIILIGIIGIAITAILDTLILYNLILVPTENLLMTLLFLMALNTVILTGSLIGGYLLA